jgi:peptidoglycan/xylan/chitin deacetylase (PgdA/CDA1 family)
MYHAVSDNCWGIAQLFVSPAEMDKQLQWLKEEGYTTIHFEDLGRVDEIEKPVLLTFDDGYLDNYSELFPLLKKHNAKATIFMITGSTGSWNHFTKEQAKEMDESGLVSLQSHTVTHEKISTLSQEQLEYELAESKKMLAEMIGKESFVLCYPYGDFSESTLLPTAEHYQFALKMSGKTFETGDPSLKIARKYVKRSTTLEEFKEMVS